jgi:hypothetical protein
MNTLTRNTAYSKGKPKEQAGLDVFADFIANKLNTTATFSDTYEENWKLGDFKLASGNYIEVKSQPIDPNKYNGQNFIEVCEFTNNSLHADGYDVLNSKLGMCGLTKELKEYNVNNRKSGSSVKFGNDNNVSVSITSMFNGSSYAYVNPELEYIYIYSAKTLLSEIVKYVNNKGFSIGSGNSHNQTISVFVPVATAVWKKENGEWNFIGSGDEQTIINWLNKNNK